MKYEIFGMSMHLKIILIQELAQLMLSLPEVSVEPVAVEQNHEKKPRITKAQKRRVSYKNFGWRILCKIFSCSLTYHNLV